MSRAPHPPHHVPTTIGSARDSGRVGDRRCAVVTGRRVGRRSSRSNVLPLLVLLDRRLRLGFSNQGASRRPADGGVEGWRFAISPATSSTIPPRHSPSFSSLCGNTPAEDGKKRVGLVIDYGTSSDAPRR